MERLKLRLDPELSYHRDRRLGFDQTGRLWVDTPHRQRPHYVCSAGVTHRRWWRLHQPGGSYPIELRCAEHEVQEA